MKMRIICASIIFLLIQGCGSDKHLPSSNPPEYDPKKVYSTAAEPPVSFSQSVMASDKPESRRKEVPDPCERALNKPPEPAEPPAGCSGVSGHDEKPTIGGVGVGGGSSSGGGGGGGGEGGAALGGEEREKDKKKERLAKGRMKLRFSQRIMADPQSSKSKIGMAQFDGTVQFEIPLEQYQHAEGLFRGEINVVRPMVVRHVRPAAHPCSGSGSEVEHWLVTAQVNPKSEFMTVQFGYDASNEQASWTCTGPAGTFADDLYVDLFGVLESVNMPTRTGTKKDFNARNLEFLEWLSVEVVEGLD